MEVTIDDHHGSDVLEVTLEESDRLEATRGAMVSRSDHVAVQSTVGDGGVTGMAKRAFSDERSVGKNVFSVRTDVGAHSGVVTLAPDRPSAITSIDLSAHDGVSVQGGALLAWTPGVEKATGLNDLGNILSSGEVTVLELGGAGRAFLGARGGLVQRVARPNEPLLVDEAHLVAWESSLTVNRMRDGDLATTVLGGEGAVTRFDGDGFVWLQRAPRRPTGRGQRRQ